MAGAASTHRASRRASPATRLATVVLMLALAALAIGAPAPARAGTLRCHGQLVKVGDPALLVRHACGKPSFRDPWWGSDETGTPPVMEWTYNHGPSALMEQIIFRDGRVASIRTAGYGFTPEPLPASGDCEPTRIQPGMTKLELLHLCGPPAQRTGDYVSASPYAGQVGYVLPGPLPSVYREHWFYNFGSAHLIRDVTLLDARVTSVDTGPRGFDPN